MSQVQTDKIWLALGDFFDLFAVEDRVYWTTFWEAYADVVADLWGLAFQIDRGKGVFATPATWERREVLVKLSDLSQSPEARFRVGAVYQDAGGRWLVRGYVPRELRTFKVEDLPTSGLIRIGVDLLPYLQVNAEPIADGSVYDGYVLEATFVLDDEPPHDYADHPDFSDPFTTQTVSLKLRVAHVAGATVVDAVLTNAEAVSVNASGLLDLGTETVAYESVTITADRYVFQLATGFQAPATEAANLHYAHAKDTEVIVYRHDVGRWSQALIGRGHFTCAAGAQALIDDQPTFVAGRAQLTGAYRLQDNVDFDVAATISLVTWPDPVINTSARRAFMRLRVGTSDCVVGLETRRSALGVTSHWLVAGVEGAEVETALASLPAVAFEVRGVRTAGVLELQYRLTDTHAYQVLTQLTVTGARTTMDLVLDDPDTGSASAVVFDAVTRRLGNVAGQTRLEDYFAATQTYAYRYAIDQRLTAAAELRDRPRVRTESMVVSQEITDASAQFIFARGADEDFVAAGVPAAGTVTIAGVAMVYEHATRDGDVFKLQLRTKIDPNLLPLAVDTPLTVATRVLLTDADYQLTGDGYLELRELPTRDRLWAPVAQVDESAIQKTWGQLVDLSADISSQTYAQRVQGTWSALMRGPSYRNLHTGLQLAMGLPTAKTTGTVTAISDFRDDLGRLVKRTLTVTSVDGAYEHELSADLYPYIDWSVDLGEAVDLFQPLTNGVEVWDVVADPLWYKRFPGTSEIERFNTFGIFVAIEALSAEASVDDALRFALRIKPTYTKLVMRFLLTSGDEDLSDEIEDTVSAALLPHVCDDIEFPEGLAPEDPLQILRLGEGHKLGQGKHLGGTWQWHYVTLGAYARQGPYADGATVATSDVFTGHGGYAYVDADVTTPDGSVAGDVFTTAGAYTFTTADVGKYIFLADGQQARIAAFVDVASVQLDRALTVVTQPCAWQLRAYGFHASDLGKNVYVHDQGEFKISGVLGAGDSAGLTTRNQARLWHTFAATATGLSWELRDYEHLGDGHTLGEIYAAKCPPPAAHEPDEYVEATQIVHVAVGV